MESAGRGVSGPIASSTVPPPPSRRKRKSRTEQSEATRERLFHSAAEVVGKLGYADASIALITQKAKVAQGTFYNYFSSRQDLLEQLLPALGERMLAHIRKEASGGKNFADLEERSFRAFFSFLRETPSFFRILNEAENFAPKGYKQHFATVLRGYVKFLHRSLREGMFSQYSEHDLEVIACILMAARTYLAFRYLNGQKDKGELPKWVVDAYMKVILYGVEGAPKDTAGDRRPGRGR